MTSGLVYQYLPLKQYFPFVGELLLVLVTVYLYRQEPKPLFPLCVLPLQRNIGYLFLGLVLGVLALLGATFLRTLYTGDVWHLSTTVHWPSLAKGLYFILPTVAVQELMFRGYLFTKTISRYGVVKANVIFAIVFMLVHVIDRDVLQHLPKMIWLIICIPIGHLWFASGLLRTKTLFFPIGLHWGNNWAGQYLIGGNNKSGETLFYFTDQQVFNTWPPYIILLLLFNGFFLLVVWATWRLGKQRDVSC